MTTVLVIGGSGVFGTRLAEGLLRLDGVEVILAGRSQERLQAAAGALPGAPRVLVLDTRTITADEIAGSRADIVIDAAGPFQGAPPRVAEAAIAAGVHYADLADARDFVAAFPRLDAAAKAAGVVALTGVSSTPALSHAALDQLTDRWHRIDTVHVGIAPGNRAPRGPSVVAAILSWIGAPVRVFEDGRWRTRPGWSHTRRATIADLGSRRLALADTPDLDLLVERFRPTATARFEAGLELGVLHHGLTLAGWLRRLRLVPNLTLLAGAARWAAERPLSLGTDRGGMIVEATGRDAGDVPTLARWTLVAEAGDGPYVPTLPAVALVARLMGPDALRPGARACAGTLTLAEITARMKPHRIATQLTTTRLPSVFERALGSQFSGLPIPIRRAHDSGPVTVLRGRAHVDGPENLAGRLFARAIGLPPAMADGAVEVVMHVGADGRETWRRDFAGHRFATTLTSGRAGVYAEALGPVHSHCSIARGTRGIDIAAHGACIGRWPLPGFLVPRARAREVVDSKGRFRFDVTVSMALFGRLAHYRGWLEPVGARARADPPDSPAGG